MLQSIIDFDMVSITDVEISQLWFIVAPCNEGVSFIDGKTRLPIGHLVMNLLAPESV